MICRSRAWRPGTQPCLLPLSPGLRLDDKSGSVIVDHESVGPLLAHRTRPSAIGHSVDDVPWWCQVVDAETIQVLRCPSRQPTNAACDLRPGAAAVVQVIEQHFCSSMGSRAHLPERTALLDRRSAELKLMCVKPGTTWPSGLGISWGHVLALVQAACRAAASRLFFFCWRCLFKHSSQCGYDLDGAAVSWRALPRAFACA
ncbi:hypothetical protein IWX49DRAFT_226690 [Phyllosticta citricarpa]